MPHAPQRSYEADELDLYYLDSSGLCEEFTYLLTNPESSRRVQIVHGIGGVGKSSLLRVFARRCAARRHAVAMAAGGDACDPISILSAWSAGLRGQRLRLTRFESTLGHLRQITAKSLQHAHQLPGASRLGVDGLGKSAAKLGVEVAASVFSFPVITPLGKALANMGTDGAAAWIGRFLSRADIDLLLDPTARLTSDFLNDLQRLFARRRLVLLLDLDDRPKSLDSWLRDLAMNLTEQSLLIIACRTAPNWASYWPDWHESVEIHQLHTLTDEELAEVARRYYATQRAEEPDLKQLESIVRFARGLPLAVTSAIQLWAKYGVDDFESVKSQVVADLMDRLTEGISREVKSGLEAAATVRWLNKGLLRRLVEESGVDTLYEELRRFPFTSTHANGIALHGAIRDLIDEDLRIHDPERRRVFHGRAADYYRSLQVAGRADNVEGLRLQEIYHRIRYEPLDGLREYQALAESFAKLRMTGRLRQLLADVSIDSFETAIGRLWYRYYQAKLAQLEAKYDEAEAVLRSIIQDDHRDSKLCAYALSDLGGLVGRRERISQDKENATEARNFLQRSIEEGLDDDPKLVETLWNIGDVYRRIGETEASLVYYGKAVSRSESLGDQAGALLLRQRLVVAMAYHGYLNILTDKEDVLRVSSQVHKDYPTMKLEFIRDLCIPLIWCGRYHQAEADAKLVLAELNRPGIDLEWAAEKRVWCLQMLCYATGMRGDAARSRNYYDQCTALLGNLNLDPHRIHYHRAVTDGYFGAALLGSRRFDEATELLKRSLEMKLRHEDILGLPEVLIWLGVASENQAAGGSAADRERLLRASSDYYLEALRVLDRLNTRMYFRAGALAGLARLDYLSGRVDRLPEIISEIEDLAGSNEYNDHLATARLIQGHLALKSQISDWKFGRDAALTYYELALIYALRFNRYLLDDILAGLPHSIFRHCRALGEEGRLILTELASRWNRGKNEVDIEQERSVSLVRRGLSLALAERRARNLDRDYRNAQVNLEGQIERELGHSLQHLPRAD